MSQKDSMTYLSELFHISSSALRYWDKEGLIRFERSPENHYRYPTLNTMLDICDVLLFREFSLPLKKIREIPSMNREQLRTALKDNENRLRQQIEELKTSIERMEQKYRMLDRADTLESNFYIEKFAFPAVQEFTFKNKNYALTYVYSPYDAVILLNPKQLSKPQYGIVYPDSAEPSLREADQQARLYLKGLFKIDADQNELHNYEEFASAAVKQGFQPGQLAGRYLITACEGKRFDYYEGWLQLL